MVRYTSGGLPEFKKSGKDIALLIPLSRDLSNFPDIIREKIPGIFSTFKNFYHRVVTENQVPPTFFVIERNGINLVFCMCIEERGFSYFNFFETVGYLEKAGEFVLYIMQDFLDAHVVNFEAFEYDVEQSFKSSLIEIVIINKEVEKVE